MLVWVLIVVAAALLAALVASRWHRDEEYEKLPGPPGYFLVANALDFLMDPDAIIAFPRPSTLPVYLEMYHRNICRSGGIAPIP
ncbi:hypothetical protein EVAR_76270_1 [Eumeta japonica]|uniref:Uncharacterized protein n=1 Tax=Eumeta variegata TaxID=151549 RepID=A0A4C1UP24_EUMVA|nr:hypothetical protein EVAR_76270_1 [Eumeta japonica]